MLTDERGSAAPQLPPKSFRALRWLAPWLVVTLIAVVAARENTKHPLDFWSHNEGYGDYVNICLSHALNIDFWLSEGPLFNGRQINDDNTLHPGFPLQASCWAAYRLVAPGAAADARARCVAAFTDPSQFWLAVRVLALALALGCAVLCARAAASSGFVYALAVGLVFFSYDPAWDYSVRLLGNESFAFPLGLAVAWVASRSLRAERLGWWALWGAVCALCWLNKLNYLAWTAAVVPAWALHAVLTRTSLRIAGARLGAFSGGFFGAAILATTLFLGTGGFAHILRMHFAVLTHSGSYGTGDAQAVSATAVRAALAALAAYWHFFVAAGAVVIASVAALIPAVKSGRVGAQRAALVIYLLSALALFFVAVLKHYGPHYLIAGVPAIVALMIVIGAQLPRPVRWVLAGLVLLAAVQSYRRYAWFAEMRYQRVLEIQTALRKANALPRNPGDVTLWTYRLPDRRYGIEYTQMLSGLPLVAEVIDAHFATDTRAYHIWKPNIRVGTDAVRFDQLPWRYAIFERGNFDHFLTGEQAWARDFFETHCRRVLDEPSLTVFERIAD